MNKIKKKRDVDILAIWSAVILLLTIGLIMIYSASATRFISSEIHGFDSMYLLKRQAFFVVIGLIFCFMFQYVNYSFIYRLAILMYVGGIALILLLKTPLGISVKGATRWLNLFGIQFQVAEFVKICVIVMMAYMIQRYSKHLSNIKLTIYMWELGGAAAMLLLIISNDLSSSLVVLGITFCVTFIYTKNEWLHLLMVVFGGVAVGGYVLSIKNNMPTAAELENMSFRVGRIAAWIDPGRYASDQGYQTLQALMLSVVVVSGEKD